MVKTDVLPDIYVLDCEQEEIRFLLANDDIIIPVPQDDGIDAIIPQLLQADLPIFLENDPSPGLPYSVNERKCFYTIIPSYCDGWLELIPFH